MNTCAATRLLIPGFIVGMVVSSIARSDLFGMVAAVATITALWLVQRVRGTTSACAVQLPEQPHHDENFSRSSPDRTPALAGDLTNTEEAR